MSAEQIPGEELGGGQFRFVTPHSSPHLKTWMLEFPRAAIELHDVARRVGAEGGDGIAIPLRYLAQCRFIAGPRPEARATEAPPEATPTQARAEGSHSAAASESMPTEQLLQRLADLLPLMEHFFGVRR